MKHLKTGRLAAVAGIAGMLTIGFAMPVQADTGGASGTVEGGARTAAAEDVSFANVTLSGANTTVSNDGSGTDWSVIDARGTGAGWAAQLSATDFTSAAGTVETTARTIAVSNLAVAAPTVTAGTGSSSEGDLTKSAIATMSGTGQNFIVAAADQGMGTYTFDPIFTLTVPASAYRSNYAVGTSGAYQPYTSTVTLDFAS